MKCQLTGVDNAVLGRRQSAMFDKLFRPWSAGKEVNFHRVLIQQFSNVSLWKGNISLIFHFCWKMFVPVNWFNLYSFFAFYLFYLLSYFSSQKPAQATITLLPNPLLTTLWYYHKRKRTSSQLFISSELTVSSDI